MHFARYGNSGTVVSAFALVIMTFGAEADEVTSHAILDDYVAAGRTSAPARPSSTSKPVASAKDGTVFPVSITLSPVRDADGVVGASVICRDTAEQA